jgi:hypothetical protein
MTNTETIIVTDKAVRAAMTSLLPELKKKSCGYAKFVLIQQGLTSTLRKSLTQHFSN